MIISSRTRTLLVGLRSILLFTVIVGVVYTGVMTGLGQLVLHRQANGSQLEVNGKVVGSTLIGQSFTDKDGKPLPEYFQPRPSAAGDDGYDGSSSGGSNMGPENPDLAKAIKERRVEKVQGMDRRTFLLETAALLALTSCSEPSGKAGMAPMISFKPFQMQR